MDFERVFGSPLSKGDAISHGIGFRDVISKQAIARFYLVMDFERVFDSPLGSGELQSRNSITKRLVVKDRTKDIGNLAGGKLLVFGGSYSNYQALQGLRALADAEGIAANRVICTGDLLGYCAQPNETVALIREWGIHCIAGNVELQIRDEEDDCGCNFGEDSQCDLDSRNWYPYTQRTLLPEHKAWLHTLPEFLRFRYAGKKVFVLHGGLLNTSQFIFESTQWPVKSEIFEATGAEVILSGHCGLPFHSVQAERYWLNPGVIGMPANDGTTRVWYMVLEAQEGGFAFAHRAFEYDYATASQHMREAGLPGTYAQTLLDGLWNNNDILPEAETALQGVRIGLAD